ncbi:hypothetical protein LLEC1_06669 [Akanthomyces lecanii]|uniref:P-type Na(+) transporter n=1 Tax=Cordyceps confragosa TaxID=2714763 RepID=A0A179IHS9_CORDF|nr:hypothetical protein LLEC1_06669 [Akanthomyces lecanii]
MGQGKQQEEQQERLQAHVSGQANKPMSAPAHALSHADVERELQVDHEVGLTPEEAKDRLEVYGRNEFGEQEGVQPFKIFIGQIANALTLVSSTVWRVLRNESIDSRGFVLNAFPPFLAERCSSVHSLDLTPEGIEMRNRCEATEHCEKKSKKKSVLTTITGPYPRHGGVITAVIILNIVVGFLQEFKAAKTMDSLRSLSSPTAQAVRSGTNQTVVTAEIVPGDVAWGLTFSDAVGRFLGVNVGTPLQRKLSKLALLLLGTAIVCAIIVLGANSFSDSQEVIIYAVATGLSMIPASLIVVLTITMAAGTKRMVQRHVIVRNLKSLEALGAVSNICSDKTGTLTQGNMIVKKAWIPGRGTLSVGNTNEPHNPTVGAIGLVPEQPKDINFGAENSEGDSINATELPTKDMTIRDYLNVASLANLASVQQVEGEWQVRGDPTEIAIQVFASRFNWNRLRLSHGEGAEWSEIAEFPFDSDVKKMSVIMEHKPSGKQHLFTKGAVERVLTSCAQYVDGDEVKELTEQVKEDTLRNMEGLARLGLRVLALASRTGIPHVKHNEAELERGDFEQDLVFRGLIGLYDPPRPESRPSVRQCHEAGISVHMLTGDHPETARAIALEVGILPSRMSEVAADVSRTMVMAASDFDKLTDQEIDSLPILPLVVARCAPQTKVRMIEALHRRKAFVAMTGDGVNDSPSLKRADVGIAMGQAGSDVAKEASDIVLTDDNFASILNAVEEGRRMFDNIQKFILHVLAENIAQACTLLIGLAFKDSRGISVFPLAPVQILWIIMITSGMPDMGLGFEIAAPDIMQRPPQNLKQGVFTPELLIDMVVYGVWMAALCICSFIVVLYGFGRGAADLGDDCNNNYHDSCKVVFRARATTFACLTWFALFLAWEMVNLRRSFFRMQPKSKRYFTQWVVDVWRNKFLFWSIVAGFVTMFPIIYIPVINTVIFKHAPISWEWGVVFIEAILFFMGIETWKWAKRVYFRRQARKHTNDRHDDLEERVFGHYFRTNTQSSVGSGDEALAEKKHNKGAGAQ